ncbi:hypothetical protein [Halocatena salina]|uniref:Uncharacterized protein n=1 Tax=Halocatena salina TaxID=2934340 RepID=A0A8U0A5S2_9EURY|nr:hypothetical protein [Halocatena salina]UPM44531.1 hypothetical protein MW046_13960 [Halocatena salina]
MYSVDFLGRSNDCWKSTKLGEITAALVVNDVPPVDASAFSVERFEN